MFMRASRRGGLTTLVTSLVVLLSIPQSVVAQLTGIPPDDRDLDRIIAMIAPWEQIAAGCVTNDCPVLDCAAAQEVHNRLRDARKYTRHVYFWLDRAAQSHYTHFETVAEQNIADLTRAARVQNILAFQQWVHGTFSTMLDVASLAGTLASLHENPKLFQSKSFEETAGLVDELYEGLKDFESAWTTLASSLANNEVPQPVAELMPNLGFVSRGELNDLKSSLSDLRSITLAAYQQGGDWRKVMREGRGAASLGQIAGRFAKAYGEAAIADRQRHIDGLLREVMGADKVLASVFDEMQRIRARRDKAADAYNALNRLVVIGTGGTPMTSCLLKLDGICPTLNLNYTSSLVMPPEAVVGNVLVLTDEEAKKPWGAALLALNTGLPQVEQLLEKTPSFPAAVLPALTLGKSIFDPGEELSVRFTAPICLASASWVGIVPSSTPHGNAQSNLDNVRSDRQLLRNAPEGTLSLTAPANPGRYDIRMNDWAAGTEIATSSFEVRNSATEEAAAPRVQVAESQAAVPTARDVERVGVVDIDWGFKPDWGSGEIGKRYSYRCPAYTPTVGFVYAYGTDVYSGNSSVCVAAVHAGVLGLAGGVVTIDIGRGEASYRGTERNGVFSKDDTGASPDFVISFVFVR